MKKVQIRKVDGAIVNAEMDGMAIVETLRHQETSKVSFDLADGFRLALRPDGTFQIFGGLMNYPSLE